MRGATARLVGGKWVINQPRCNNTGVFFGNSEISMKHITDGTSKTFAIGERDKFCLAATWIGVRNPFGPDMWSSNWALAHVFFKLNHPTTGDHNTCTESFSSAIPGGGFFAFCDGSVRFISDDIRFRSIRQCSGLLLYTASEQQTVFSTKRCRRFDWNLSTTGLAERWA